MSKILFISNGHGEDLISLRIMSALQKINNDNNLYVLPMVGEGQVFSDHNDIEIIGPQKETSSGGFIKSIGPLIKDLYSGILLLHFKQIMNASKNKYDLVVCVGDFCHLYFHIYLLSLQRLFLYLLLNQIFLSLILEWNGIF